MAGRNGTKHRAHRVGASRRSPFVAAALVAGLAVPLMLSTPSDASDGDLVDGLTLVSDPAPLGPFAAQTLTGNDPGGESAAPPSISPPSISEAFTLHSRPGATRKILLDFDGETVINANWNRGQRIDAAAYSFGSNQSDESFSADDLIAMKKIWTSVSEDFGAWDVDVTTEDPGAAGLARNGGGDVEYGVRVVITPTSSWFGSGTSGGVAYLDTFDRFEDLPAWVFSGNLANGDAKSVAEAVSHEVGHTLGLDHDGVTVNNLDGTTTRYEYYSGHGDWAPIMGVGYYRPITQWSKGEYPGATLKQDDLAIIDSYLSRLGSTGAGSNMVGPGDSTATHTITRGGDADVHVLRVETSPVAVSVEKADPGGNLLAEIRVRNVSGQVIASAAPTHSAIWSLDVSLPAGTPSGLYTIEVESIGWAPGSDPGFSSYSSIGDYVLSIDAAGWTTTTTAPSTTVAPTTAAPTTTTTTTTTTPSTTPAPEPATSGDRLTAITPRRLLDTRSPDAAIAGPLPAGRDTSVAISGIPANATAVVVNVTAVAPQASGYFSLTPCGVADDARTSSLNFSAGRNIANSVIVPTSSGQICLFSSVPAHALLDVTGWIGASGELSLERLGSTRVVDTRDGTGVSRRLSAGVRTPVSLAPILAGRAVGAVALNVTAVRPSSGGFLTIDDCSGGQQPTSSLNFVADEVRGNNGVFALGDGEQLCVTSSAATHLTIDVTGEFGSAPGLTFVPSTSPARILDTRNTGPLNPGGSTAFEVDSAPGANSLGRSPIAASINLTATRHDGSGYVTAWACGERPSTSALNPSIGTATANGALIELSPTGKSCLFHSTGGHLIVDLAGWWI